MHFLHLSSSKTKLIAATISSLISTGTAIAENKADQDEPVQINHKTTFDVRFGKLSVGEMSFVISSDHKSYILKGTGRTKGLAEWFAAGKANMKSSGLLSSNAVMAENHSISISDKKKTATLNMSLNNGQLTDIVMKPDKTKKHLGKKYVTITDAHLQNIIDPASTLVIPVPYELASDPKNVCDRTHRVYDGETRYDMQLSYKKNAPIKTRGYNGHAIVCKLKYIPVAGHKPTNKNAKRMSKNNKMEIWMAPMQQTNIFTPIRIKIPTWIGTFYAEPTYFGTN